MTNNTVGFEVADAVKITVTIKVVVVAVKIAGVEVVKL